MLLSSTISTLIGGMATSRGSDCVPAEPRFVVSFLPEGRTVRGEGGRCGCGAGGVASAPVVGGENGTDCCDCGEDWSGSDGGGAGAVERAVETEDDAGIMGSASETSGQHQVAFFIFLALPLSFYFEAFERGREWHGGIMNKEAHH